MFGSNEALLQAGKPVSDEPASKFIIPSSAHSNGGHPEHLENALAARQADNSAYVEKQRALCPAAPSPLRNEVQVTEAAPKDFPTLGGNDNMGKAGSDSGKNKKSYKDVADSGINWVGQSTQKWTKRTMSDQEWSQGIQSSESELAFPTLLLPPRVGKSLGSTVVTCTSFLRGDVAAGQSALCFST